MFLSKSLKYEICTLKQSLIDNTLIKAKFVRAVEPQGSALNN